MTQLLTIVALLAIGYLLYRSLVVKKVTPNEEKEAKPAEELSVKKDVPAKPEVTPAPAATAAKEPAKPAKPVKTPAAEAAVPEVAPQVPVSKPIPAATATAYAAQVALLENTMDPVARHRLYQQIVDICYRERADAEAQSALLKYAQQHIDEFSKIEGPLKKQNGGKLPQVNTFKHYAALLTEQGKYDEAIKVCEKAIALGLKDGTKTGYQGRLERIKAKKAAG